MISQQKKVLFFSLYSIPPAWLFHHQVDATVASALRMRDCDVLITGCDGLFKSCYILRGAGEAKNNLCKYCSQTSKEYFNNSFQLPYKQLRDFVSADDYNLALQWIETVDPKNYAEASYQDLAIGQWVTSSIYTYFRITSKGLSRPDVRKVHRDYLIDGLVTYKAVSRLINYYQPTHLFLLGARLAPSRIAFEVARKLNIDVVVQERGYINDSYTLVNNHTCLDTKPKQHVINAWENIPLDNSELLQVKKYWLDRESGQNLNYLSFYDYQTEYTSVRRRLNIPEDAKIFVVFTSSEDELAMFQDFAEINVQLDIIERLIEIFAERDEYLVIRHHPNIGGNKHLPAEMDFIARAYQQSLSVPSNVRIVMPFEQLTSYALLWHTDAAIAFFSTMAIECVAKGIPTASSKQSLYHQALRYIIHQSDTESLRTLVDSLFSESAKPTLEDLKKVYRFTNALFFKYSNKFSSFNAQGLTYESNDELKVGIDPVLDKVCNHILYGSSLYNLPTDNDKKRSVTEENDFLKKHLLEIEDFRNRIQSETLTQKKLNLDIVYPPVGVININYQNEEIGTQSILSKGLKRSRYQQINEYSCDNFYLDNYPQGLEEIINLLENIPDEYIILTHRNIQYHESIISSAMETLLADTEQNIQGVWFGGWLPDNQNRVEKGVFLPQGIFTSRNIVFNYEEAVTILQWLEYPPTALAFSLMRKKALVKILDIAKHIPTRKQAAELLFIYLHMPEIRKLEKPMLYIHEIPKLVQKNVQKEKQAVIKESLNLKDINLIVFPNWRESEELLLANLEEIIRSICVHPNTSNTTLLIDISNIYEDEANLILSTVMMNLLVQENIDLTDKATISLVKELSTVEWEALLPNISAQIDWKDKQRINVLDKTKNIPVDKLDSLINV